MTVVQSLPDLFQLHIVARFYLDATFAAWWKVNFASTVGALKLVEAELKTSLPDRIVEAVGDMTIVDSEIPEDNHEASVSGVGEAADIEIDWDEAVSLGDPTKPGKLRLIVGSDSVPVQGP